jgi:hypothetical protein
MLGDNVAGKGCHLYLWLLRGPVVPERSVTRSIDLDANICARHANPAGVMTIAASLAALRSAATNRLAVFDARAHEGVDGACRQGPGAFRGQRSAPDLASMLGDNVVGKGCHLYLWLLRGPVVPERSVTRSIDLDANICARHANPAGVVTIAG